LFIITSNGLAMKEEATKISTAEQYSELTKNNSKKPAHRSLNTDYVELKVTYTPCAANGGACSVNGDCCSDNCQNSICCANGQTCCSLDSHCPADSCLADCEKRDNYCDAVTDHYCKYTDSYCNENYRCSSGSCINTGFCGYSGYNQCNGLCQKGRDAYRCNAAHSCAYDTGDNDWADCSAGTGCSGGTCDAANLCDATWKYCSCAGDNCYNGGGSYYCQGSCDGSNNCDYSINCDTVPSASDSLLCKGENNPMAVADETPEFSAVYHDPDAGDIANYYQIQVDNDSGFGSVYWDSTKTSMANCVENNRCQDIIYGGTTPLARAIKWYWRIKFWDDGGAEGAWSSEQGYFQMFSPLPSGIGPSGGGFMMF